MSTVLILLVVSAVVCLITTAMIKSDNEWRNLPHFVRNYVGGKLAVCSIVDYNNAKKTGVTVNGMIMVKDTFVVKGGGLFRILSPSPIVNDLFVPFASEKFMSFDQQTRFFVVSQDPREFAERKKLENRANDRRLRFVTWMEKHNVWKWRLWSGVLSLAMLFVVGGEMISRAAKSEVIIYTTDAHGVHETKTIERESARLLMIHGEHTDGQIIHGKVSLVQSVAEGLAIACITRDSSQMICAFAPSSIKVGEEAFRRTGKIATGMSSSGVSAVRDEGMWLINKKEADALVATGKFHIAN